MNKAAITILSSGFDYPGAKQPNGMPWIFSFHADLPDGTPLILIADTKMNEGSSATNCMHSLISYVNRSHPVTPKTILVELDSDGYFDLVKPKIDAHGKITSIDFEQLVCGDSVRNADAFVSLFGEVGENMLDRLKFKLKLQEAELKIVEIKNLLIDEAEKIKSDVNQDASVKGIVQNGPANMSIASSSAINAGLSLSAFTYLPKMQARRLCEIIDEMPQSPLTSTERLHEIMEMNKDRKTNDRYHPEYIKKIRPFLANAIALSDTMKSIVNTITPRVEQKRMPM